MNRRNFLKLTGKSAAAGVVAATSSKVSMISSLTKYSQTTKNMFSSLQNVSALKPEKEKVNSPIVRYRSEEYPTVILIGDIHEDSEGEEGWWGIEKKQLEILKSQYGVDNVALEGWCGKQTDSRRGYRYLNGEWKLIEYLLENSLYSKVLPLEHPRLQMEALKVVITPYHFYRKKNATELERILREEFSTEQRKRAREFVDIAKSMIEGPSYPRIVDELINLEKEGIVSEDVYSKLSSCIREIESNDVAMLKLVSQAYFFGTGYVKENIQGEEFVLRPSQDTLYGREFKKVCKKLAEMEKYIQKYKKKYLDNYKTTKQEVIYDQREVYATDKLVEYLEGKGSVRVAVVYGEAHLQRLADLLDKKLDGKINLYAAT